VFHEFVVHILQWIPFLIGFSYLSMLLSILFIHREFLITGDFNIRVDDLTDSIVIHLLSLLDHATLTQHISFPIKG